MFGKNATWPGSGWRTDTPSKRYSFVRGRPPLMRGSDEPGGNATPGTRPVSEMKLRPFSGRSTTLRVSTTCPRAEVALRSREASAVTVTTSATPPIPSARSTRMVSPVANQMPLRRNGRNPVASARTS